MNLLAEPGFSALTEDGSTPEFFLSGICTVEVPTVHDEVNQDLGSGTLSLQISTDSEGATRTWRTYTDSESNAASISTVGRVLAVQFGDKHPTRCRLTLASSTDPQIDCINITGEYGREV